MQTRELRHIASAIESAASSPSLRNTGHEATRPEKLPLMARFCLAFGGGARAENRLRACLRQFPIVIFVGPNGGGKTLGMMVVTQPTRAGIRWVCDNPDHNHTKRGVTSGWRRMLSTVPILDSSGVGYRPGGLHPLYDEFNDYSQLVDAEHCDIYMDEIVTVASSRESQRMDARVLTKLVQLRKADCALFATAPNWARMDKALREVCQAVVECRGHYPVKQQLEEGSPLWRPKRVFNFAVYDSMEFDEWTAAKRDKIKNLAAVWFHGPGSDAFASYHTLGSVSVLASMTPEDTCTVCEGAVRRHTCSCNRPPRRPTTRNASHQLSNLGAPTAPEFEHAPA